MTAEQLYIVATEFVDGFSHDMTDPDQLRAHLEAAFGWTAVLAAAGLVHRGPPYTEDEGRAITIGTKIAESYCEGYGGLDALLADHKPASH